MAVVLVERLPFDDGVKERFTMEMRQGRFEKHQSFLSNPLLLSIMLLTYSDVAHIPRKLSTFYNLAYEALFHRHDAQKGGYLRERRCGLDIHDFAKGFAALSLLTYDRREFAFTRGRALEAIGEARGLAMLDFEPEAFLGDAQQAICLLVEDGLEIAFAHRSFQEYFVARFIQASPPGSKAELVKRFAPSVQADAVMGLLWEMDKYIVEKYYLLPIRQELRETLGVRKKAGITHLTKYIRLVFSEVSVEDDEDAWGVRATIGNERIFTACRFAIMYYRGLSPVPSDEEKKQYQEGMVAAFRTDDGDCEELPTKRLKSRGHFVRWCAARGNMWSLGHLNRLLEIEEDIRARLQQSQESIEQVLSMQHNGRPRPSRQQ